MKFTELMWPRDGKEKKCRVPPAWLQVYSWVSALIIFIQHDYLLRNFFFSSVSYCQLTQSFTFFKPMICSIDLEGSLKVTLENVYCGLHCTNMILIYVFYFVYIYIVYIYFFSLYIKVCYFVSIKIHLTPQRTKLKNISWVLYWTKALINTWKCIQSRSAARVKILNERKLLQEKKKSKEVNNMLMITYITLKGYLYSFTL